MRRYTDEGWIDADNLIDKCGCAFIYFIGPRRCGKTESVLRKFYRERQEKPFIFMRRKEGQLESACAPDGNPFKAMNKDLQLSVVPFKEGKLWHFSNSHIEEDKVVEDNRVCLAASISALGRMRGANYDDYERILLDECVMVPTETRSKNEGSAMLNFYDTVNSNREIDGKPPVQLICCGNSDILDSPCLQAQKVNEIIEQMMREGKLEYINKERSIAVFLFSDSEKAKERGETSVLYKSLDDDDPYKQMAVNNHFVDLDASMKYIGSKPLNEYVCKYGIKNVYLYRHKSKNEWYVCNHRSGNPDMYEDNVEGHRRFRLQNPHVHDAYIYDHMIFSSYANMTKIRRVLGYR